MKRTIPILLACLCAGCTTVTNPDGSKTTSLDPAFKAAGTHALIAVITAAEVRALEKIRGTKVETMAAPAERSGK